MVKRILQTTVSEEEFKEIKTFLVRHGLRVDKTLLAALRVYTINYKEVKRLSRRLETNEPETITLALISLKDNLGESND